MLPNWYGIPGIGFEWRGAWNDPMLHYKGHAFNAHDMQDGLWENYQEDLKNGYTFLEWEEYVRDNYLDDALFLSGRNGNHVCVCLTWYYFHYQPCLRGFARVCV